MPKGRSRAVIIVGALMGLFLLLYQLATPSDTFSPKGPIVIATGQVGGVYDGFARLLPKALGLPISLRNSAGSLENIELLRNRQVDYAIVQSDIAQHAYFGQRQRARFGDLALVMPLFPEFVQIVVRADSDIRILSDLRGRRVCIGPEGSGTYFNGIDVLSEAGLRESIDFIPVNQSANACLRDLLRGANVDVLFVTSNLNYAETEPRVRQLYLSDSALRSLTARHPYFRTERVLRSGRVIASQLVVDAQLVTHSGQSAASVYSMTRRLIRSWNSLSGSVAGLIRPGTRTQGRIPYHSSAQSALISMGVQERSYYFYVLIAAWALLLILCIVSERAKNSYNRLGESTISAFGHRVLVKQVGRVSHLFIALTMLLLFFAFAVYCLLLVEDFYAQQLGAVSPFTSMDYFDSILWLFTYIASGFTADGIYPVSIAGKIIVAILAIVGLVAPITGVIFVVNLAGRKAQREMQGLGRTNLADHVVLCGWNEKVPGLIYTLTGRDVDRRMQVVLIADFEETYPLEKYRFSPKYLTYCRGDTADPTVLERASVEHASVVIVLADFQASKAHNRKSILTVMNVRRVNKTAYICAELEYIDNVDFYQAGGCDSLIYTGLVISRLATATVLSPLILDYVLDVITYHEFDELRSATVADCPGLADAIGRSIMELELALLCQNVNLVGVLHGGVRASLHDTIFGSAEQRGALLAAKDRDLPLEATDILVYSSEHENVALRSSAGVAVGNFRPLTDRSFAMDYPKRLAVLVCADAETIAALERGLSQVIEELRLVKIDTDAEPLRYIEQVDRIAPGHFDRVVILGSQARRSELSSFDDLNEIDAELILTTRLLKEAFLQREGAGPTIISEISNIRNKPLLVESGADVVLPALLATERFLAKEAYDKNNVTDFLMAALNVEDCVHLHNHTVFEGDGFCGERYSDILCTPGEGFKVLAFLPWSERDELANTQGDFGFHFRTVIDDRLHHQIAEAGDEIIMMIEKRDAYRSAVRQDPAADAVPQALAECAAPK